MAKRRTREDDSLLMPPPAPSGRVLHPQDGGHEPSKRLAPTSSPSLPQPPVASVPRPAFGRHNSVGARRRSALDNIGYVPEDIPTPRITRPLTIAVRTGKRQRGLKVFDTAATSPVRPAKPAIQPAASPSKHGTPSKHPAEPEDDNDYIVDSSDDEGPVRFNLPPEDAPRSSKIQRTSTSNPSVNPTPSTSRLGPGATPARRKALVARLGITPARIVATSHPKPTTTAQISTSPIRFDLSTTKSRPVFRSKLSASEASPFVSSPHRARIVPTRAKPADGPTRIAELKTTGPTPLSTVTKRSFSSSGARQGSSLAAAARAPSPTPAGTGTKRAPGSKSASPGAPGPKRPRVATPSPPAAEEIIIVSSDDEEPPDERRPSPSPSLGDYRPTPARSRRSSSASSDVVLVEPPAAEQDAPRRESPREEAPAQDPPRETTPEPAPPPEEAPKRPSVPKDVPRPDSPPTPSPSRHSSSSSGRAKASAKSVEVVESSDSLRPFRGRRVVPGRGRRKRVSQREPQSPEPESETSPQEEEALPPRPTDRSPPQPEPSPSEPSNPHPSRRQGSTETLPPKREESAPRITPMPPRWTGTPLFRPSTIASGLTPLRDSPDRSFRPTPGPSKPRNPEPTKSPEIDRVSLLGDDPLQAMYDSSPRPMFGPPQYCVMGPPQPPRAFPSQSPGPSTIFSYSRLSVVSSVPPPTINSLLPPPAHNRVQRRRMDCVLLPRASKATRRALQREYQKKTPGLTITIPPKKDKGKAKDPSEYPPSPSPSPSPSASSGASFESEAPSSPEPTTGPARKTQPVKCVVIDPQLALRSNYDSLPPEIDGSPDRYCHCCRTRSGVGKLKMRCVSMSYRRRRGVVGNGPHECGLFWCQKCVAKHDMPFNPMSDNFKCPFCSGRCECDVCRRDRGQEKLGRGTIKYVIAKPGKPGKPGKRTLDAFVKDRIALGANKPGNATAGPSNPAGSSDPVAESSNPAVAGPSNPVVAVEPSITTAPEPEPEGSETTGPGPEPEPESAPAPSPALPPATEKTTPVERGPTTWHGRHTPPPLRRRCASGGHTLSTEAHIFIPRRPRESEIEPVPEEDENENVEGEEDEEKESGLGDRHRVFEGDYSAVGEPSLLGADSGAFEFEHGSGTLGHAAEDTGVTRAGAEPEHLGREVITGDSVVEGGGEPPTAHIPTDEEARNSLELLGGILAYPPSESSQGSQPDAPVEIHTAPLETVTHTITGTLDDHGPISTLEIPAASALADASSEISHDALAKIFDESVQGFAESEAEHDYGPTARHTSEIDELQSTREIGEPQPPTPDLDEIRAALGLGDTTNHEGPISEFGQLHPEGTFETVPRISMGGGSGGLTYGSLQDISLFNAVMDCSDETRDIALSSSQTEPPFIVCGSLLDQIYSYPFDLERLAIPELEDSESEHEPDLIPNTDPESSKSTILGTPSPQLEPDTEPNSANFQNLFDTNKSPFILSADAKQVHMRKFLRSHFAQRVEPETRTTRSQTRKSVMERGKFLRSKRCYGVAL
ncbi:Mucin-2 [Rhizoctonia solani]|uniref:Mucin-2 n=1 Tax=Rhizoctonia solani TaxID=456999 RepID=A0A0K6FZ52_9AGAM|nr:Mucin-2 [Rhizoctonia solani]